MIWYCPDIHKVVVIRGPVGDNTVEYIGNRIAFSSFERTPISKYMHFRIVDRSSLVIAIY